MTNIVMVHVGDVNGVRAYAPLNAEDERIINDRDMFACDTKGYKAMRTVLQNKSLHKYCSMLADHFNTAGLDMQAVLEAKTVPVSWTTESVKEVIWRVVQAAMFPDKSSTAKLETHEVDQVYQVVSRHLAVTFGISQSFPSRHGDL